MTVVVETFKNAAGTPRTGAVTFTPCGLTEDPDSAVIDDCPVTFQITAGELTTADLAPGCYTIRIVLDCPQCPGPREFGPLMLQDSPVPVELFDVIDAMVPPPPDLPEYVVSVAGISGVVTIAQLQALLGITPDNDESFATTVGDGTTGPFVVTHNLGTTDIDVTVRDLATGYAIEVAWRVVDANTISVEPDIAWQANTRRILVEKVT